MAARKLRASDPEAAEPSKPKILVFGRPAVGKTWTSLDFPSVYYIDTEGGADLAHYTNKLKQSGGMYLGPKDGANDFDTVIDEIITLATTEHHFRTLVIDSYSKLFNTQVDMTYEAMTKAGRDMEKTFGAEKKPAISSTRRMVRWFDKLDMNVILICHEKAMFKDGKDIGVSFDGWDKLEYELHLALHITKIGDGKNAKRMAQVRKTRLTGFPDGERFDWAYEGFAERYGRDIIEADAKIVKIASAEQIARLRELLTALGVSQDNIAKMLEKANAEVFEEVSADTMQKWIDELSKRVSKLVAA